MSETITKEDEVLERQQQQLRASGVPILEFKIGGESVAVPDWDKIQFRERELLRRTGDEIGYGRCIQILQQEWSNKLMVDPYHPHDRQTADLSAGTICVWCHTDRRTGKVVPMPSRKKSRKVKS